MFTYNGVAGLPKVTEMKSLDIISPLIVALLDTVCLQSHNCPIKTVLTEYLYIINSVCWWNGRRQ